MSNRIFKFINFCFIIAITVFVILNVNINCVLGTGSMEFNLEDVSGKPGDEITVHLKVANNPGVRVLAGKISFDRSKLDFVSCKLKNLEKAVNKDIQFNESTGNIVFYATTMTNNDDLINDNDVIVEIKLKIKNDATGTASVNIAMDDVSSSINQAITDYTQKNAIIIIEGTSNDASSTSTENNNQSDNSSVENNNDENNNNVNNNTIINNGENQSGNGTSTDEIQANIEQKTSPTTGDIAIGIFIILLIVSAIGIIVILIKRKKKNNEQKFEK